MKLDLGALPGRFGKGLQKVFGSANQRSLNKYQPVVAAINDRAAWAEALDNEQIRAEVQKWRTKVRAGEATLDDALVDMFAMTRVAAQRTLGMSHFDVQLIGGMTLHDGRIAEMSTGEGKTLVATLPAALNALEGKGVYIVTVNDYLAKRDRDWMAPVLELLGLTVGAIQSKMSPRERLAEYACDVLYGTNNEFGFDYLRDNMKWATAEQVQKQLHYAIVDEVDSILIDEARTPLIISGEPEGHSDKYVTADRIARQLKDEEHFEVKLKEQQCLLTDAGAERAEQLAGVGSFFADPANMDWPHHIEQALRAHHIYKRDTQYVVAKNDRNGRTEVIIVDEFTGRLMVGRRWSDGLHQAVEAKEGLPPQQESQTLATITLQNYFRMFKKLSGMTGTAMTEAAEFGKIYKLDVVSIPTNRPMIRKDRDDHVYLGEEDKYEAIVVEITEQHAKGRPMLVGTTSIEKSEKLSSLLKKAGVRHEVLNAKYHEREAEIVAQAGRLGAVTVATNMAGRGTDIVLGGNAERMLQLDPAAAAAAAAGAEVDAAAAAQRLAELRKTCQADGAKIKELGGLLVVATERHEARRIDNQLRGRCARQGDPGETVFYLSFDDDLMKIFARDWVKTMMEKLGLRAGERIESPMVSRGLENAQKKVEQRNFDIRKNLIEYDEVMDKQRKFIYEQRQDVLEMKGLQEKLVGMFDEAVGPVIELHGGDKNLPVEHGEIRGWMHHKCGDAVTLDGLEEIERDGLHDWIVGRFEAGVETRRVEYGDDEKWRLNMQVLLLKTIDEKWRDHLHAMDVLKAGIGMRAFAQIDPKNEYKKEGFEKFQLLKAAIAEHVTNLIFKVDFATELLRQRMAPQRRMAMPRMPQDPATQKAMIEAWIASGQAPPEVVEAVRKGATIRIGPANELERERRAMAQRQAQLQAQGGAGSSAVPAAGSEAAGSSTAPAQSTGTQEAKAPATGSQAAESGSGPAQPGAVGAKPNQAASPATGGEQVAVAKAGRNDPCPCGSGKKYKKCHGAG